MECRLHGVEGAVGEVGAIVAGEGAVVTHGRPVAPLQIERRARPPRGWAASAAPAWQGHHAACARPVSSRRRTIPCRTNRSRCRTGLAPSSPVGRRIAWAARSRARCAPRSSPSTATPACVARCPSSPHTSPPCPWATPAPAAAGWGCPAAAAVSIARVSAATVSVAIVSAAMCGAPGRRRARSAWPMAAPTAAPCCRSSAAPRSAAP
eukprot:scaffold82522_cov57-Phaeocystis_antarctica.AAC.3